MDRTTSPARIDYRKRIYRSMDHISHNLDRELSLEEIAGVASFSPFHFHRIFKAVVGENVAEFTWRLRIELAANRLKASPAADVTSIALSCGFSSSQNFAKAFRRHFGTSPTAFRRSKDGPAEKGPRGFDAAASGLADAPGQVLLREASVRILPSVRAAGVRRIGMDPLAVSGAFRELLAWARDQGGSGPGPLFALYWDNPEVTPLGKCRFDCCVPIPDNLSPHEPISLMQIGGGPWAVCRFEAKPEGFRQAWDEAFRWVVGSGYECRPLPCYEVYLNDAREHPEGLWIFEIAIPLAESPQAGKRTTSPS